MAEIIALNINVDSEDISQSTYTKILNKIFAALRHEMYKNIQAFWKEFGDEILERN